MTLPQLLQIALVVLVVVAVLAAGLAVWIGVRTWRDLQRIRMTRDVAVQLLDAHAARLQDAVDEASAGVARAADGGEELAEQLAELRADVSHLRWMLGRIPDARARLREELLELVLPTDASEARADARKERANA